MVETIAMADQESESRTHLVQALGSLGNTHVADRVLGDLEMVGVLRYLTRVAEYDDENLLDMGARAGFDVGKASVSGDTGSEWVRSACAKARTAASGCCSCFAVVCAKSSTGMW